MGLSAKQYRRVEDTLQARGYNDYEWIGLLF